MNELEFRQKFQSEKAVFLAWGEFIKKSLIETIIGGKDGATINDLLKLEVKVRVKDENSLVQKAFYRPEKSYTSPYEQITDKVGLRLVVLLNSEVALIKSLVESNREWIARNDRDFEELRLEKPEIFGYESVHYIIYNNQAREFNSVEIPLDIPCELQIRTLLQHAHSELTHDRVYKPKVEASPEVKRVVSRCAALVEVTAELFSIVDEKMTEALSRQEVSTDHLKRVFFTAVPKAKSFFNERLNDYVISKIEPLLAQEPHLEIHEVKLFLDTHTPFVYDRLNSRVEWDLLAAQPVALLIYFLVQKMPSQLKAVWENTLPPSQLEPFFIDLGRSM